MNEKVVEAAHQAYRRDGLSGPAHDAQLRAALEAAHDPALGLDRSVPLRDVVEALDAAFDSDALAPINLSDHIKRTFTR